MPRSMLLGNAIAMLLGLTTVWPLRAGEHGAAEKPALSITISRQTTRVVRPLRDDGYVDYFGAINEFCGRGVTPENNAVVLYWQAMGPTDLGEDYQRRYFALLGVSPPAERKGYFVAFDAYVEKQGTTGFGGADSSHPAEQTDADQQLQRALQGPWSADECPMVARWLKASRRPLAVLIEASRRPRYYSPVLSEDEQGMLLGALLPVAQGMRDVVKALTTRAMWRLHGGQLEAAWGDLLAAHRLARLVGQGPCLVEAHVSLSLEGVAASGTAALAQSGRLTADQARRCRTDLGKLAPLPRTADKADRFERLSYLDVVATVAREGFSPLEGNLEDLSAVEGIAKDSSEPQWQRIYHGLTRWGLNVIVDWDKILVFGNAFYDRIAEACRKSDYAQRAEAIDALGAKIVALGKKRSDARPSPWEVVASPRATFTEHVNAILISLLMPAFGAAMRDEDCLTARESLTHVALALAGYRSDRGEYPEKLSALAPKYIDKLPKDLFTGENFRYRRQGKGYLLYSLGPNRKDDRGRNHELDDIDWDDPTLEDYQGGDDITVRTPKQPP